MEDNERPDIVTDDSPPPESPTEWLARIDAAIQNNPEPTSTFTPLSTPGIQPTVVDQEDDTGVAIANDLDGDNLEVLRDFLPSLLPLAVRLVALHNDRRGGDRLERVLDEIGYPKTEYPRPGFVTVHPERQKVYDALSRVS